MKFIKLSFFLILFPTVAVSQNIFSDISQNHTNFSAINFLYEKGIFKGYDDGTFKDKKILNRVESLKVILGTFRIKNLQNTKNILNFTDVPSDSWYFTYLSTAKSLGIVSGYKDGTFKPANQVNLAETLKLLIQSSGIYFEKNIQKAPYFDVNKFSWFAPYFQFAKDNNLIDYPKNGKIFPGKKISRGEFAEIVYRFLKNIENQEKIIAEKYDDSFEGKNLLSGEKYSFEKFSGAHKTFSFGTKIKVKNKKNGKSVIIQINDRLNSESSRQIKLSKKAFNSLAEGSENFIEVEIQKISIKKDDKYLPIKKNCSFSAPNKTIKKKFFENIELFSKINSIFRENEIYNISGKVLNGDRNIFIYLIDEFGNKKIFKQENLKSNIFSIDIDLGEKGKKQIGIITKQIGKTFLANVEVFKKKCQRDFLKTFEIKAKNLHFIIKNNDTYLKWVGTGNLVRIGLFQGEKSVIKILNKEDNYFKLNPLWFKRFSEGEIFWQISLAGKSKKDSFSQKNAWNISEMQKTKISKHFYSEVDNDFAEVLNLPNSYIFGENVFIKIRAKGEIKKDAYLVSPDKNIRKIKLQSNKKIIKNKFGVEIFPKISEVFLSFKAKKHGTYILEINHSSGIAAVNIPIYEKFFMPIIPDYKDLLLEGNIKEDDLKNIKNLESQMLNLVNSSRKNIGINRLILNPSLSALAQKKAEDMAQNNYVGHWNSEGKTLNDIRFEFGLKNYVSENIAKSINTEYAHFGLMRSPAHKENILNSEWTRVGFGFSKDKNGSLLVVQAFSSSPILEEKFQKMREQIIGKINEKRVNYLTSNSVLHAISQNWSEIMTKNDFFDFQKNTFSLNENIKEAGLSSTVGNLIIAHSSWKGAIGEILKHKRLFEKVWKKIGVGIKQDINGVIKITIIYSN